MTMYVATLEYARVVLVYSFVLSSMSDRGGKQEFRIHTSAEMNDECGGLVVTLNLRSECSVRAGAYSSTSE